MSDQREPGTGVGAVGLHPPGRARRAARGGGGLDRVPDPTGGPAARGGRRGRRPGGSGRGVAPRPRRPGSRRQPRGRRRPQPRRRAGRHRRGGLPRRRRGGRPGLGGAAPRAARAVAGDRGVRALAAGLRAQATVLVARRVPVDGRVQLSGDARPARRGAQRVRRVRGAAARHPAGAGRVRPRHRLPGRLGRWRRGGGLLPAGRPGDRRHLRLRAGGDDPAPGARRAAHAAVLPAPLLRRGRGQGPDGRPARRVLPRAGAVLRHCAAARPAAGAAALPASGPAPPGWCWRRWRCWPDWPSAGCDPGRRDEGAAGRAVLPAGDRRGGAPRAATWPARWQDAATTCTWRRWTPVPPRSPPRGHGAPAGERRRGTCRRCTRPRTGRWRCRCRTR